MPDLSQEATLTIKLEDGGTTAGPGGGAPGGGGAPAGDFARILADLEQAIGAAAKRISGYGPAGGGGGGGASPGKPGGGAAAFDPVAEAFKRIHREQQQRQIEDAYRRIVGHPAQAPFDPVKEAQERIAKEQQQSQVEAEYRKLRGLPDPSVFDPVKEAQKQIEAERRRRAVEQEYLRQTTTALDRFNEALEFSGRRLGEFAQAAAAVNQLLSAQIQIEAAKLVGAPPAQTRAAERKWWWDAAATAVRWTGRGAAGVMAATGVGRPAAGGTLLVTESAAAGIEGLGDYFTKPEESFLATQQALRQRIARAARFGGPAANALAQAELAQVVRSLTEAQVLGPQYARFARQQTEYDRLTDLKAALENKLQEQENLRKGADEIKKVRGEVEAMAAQLGEIGRAIQKAFEKDPAEEVRKKLERARWQQAADPRDRGKKAGVEGVLGRIRDVQAAQPVFRGL